VPRHPGRRRRKALRRDSTLKAATPRAGMLPPEFSYILGIARAPPPAGLARFAALASVVPARAEKWADDEGAVVKTAEK
jgi:hypothetical protein